MVKIVLDILPLLVAGLLIASAIWEFMSWRLKFSHWAHGVATSLGAVKNKGDVGPRLAYEYTIDGTSYESQSGYMKDTLPTKGEDIKIYYDPKNPGDSEWYHGSLHRYLMFGSAAIGAFILWLSF